MSGFVFGGLDKIVVYDILQKKLFEINNPDLVNQIDLVSVDANILLIEIYKNEKVMREKLIIIK